MKRLAILLSGRGSNFEAIARNVSEGRLPCEIALVLSNRESAPGLERARELGLPWKFLSSSGKDRSVFDTEVADVLERERVDLVCLAGYMRVLSGDFVRRFAGRIVNIHPSLLPAFPGLDAQGQALAHGVKITGCTVHLVDEGLDNGPILMQAAVPVSDEDSVESLSARILKEEHRIYSEAIRALLAGRYRLSGRRATLI